MKSFSRKIALLLSVLIIISMCMVGVVGTAAATVNGEAIAAGDTIKYYVYLKSTEKIVNGEGSVTYPNEKLELIGLTFSETGVVGISGAMPIVGDSAQMNEQTAGTVQFNFTNYSSPYDFSADEAILCALTFKVKEALTDEDALNITNAIAYIGAEDKESAQESIDLIKDGQAVEGAAEAKITDKVEIAKYTVTAAVEGGNGTVEPATQTVKAGSEVTVTFIPDEGYIIDTVKADGNPVTVTENEYKFVLEKDTAITVTYRAEYSVTVTAGANGTAEADKAVVVAGKPIVITVTPDEGYEVDTFTVDGAAAELTDNTYTITPDEAKNIAVAVTFKAVKEPINAEALQSAVTAATPDLTNEEYTEASRNALKTAIDNANALLAKVESGDAVTQEQIDNAKKAVEDAKAALETVPVDPPKPTWKLGDVNHDEAIDSTDATLVLQRYADIINDNTEGYYKEQADVDGANGVDSTDATLILQYFAEIIKAFPAENANA